MFWELKKVCRTGVLPDLEEDAGRFVLHRHRDGAGVHLDLRLEQGAFLVGWRISGEGLEEGAWATEKMPHPVEWLSRDHGLERRMEGRWRWQEKDENRLSLILCGGEEAWELDFERCSDLHVETLRALAEVVRRNELRWEGVAGLVEDGCSARTREIGRFCALSRHLDGEGFDETGWRRLFEGMNLREISERLSKVEIRHDRIRPPQPVSEGESLEEGRVSSRSRHAYEILHS